LNGWQQDPEEPSGPFSQKRNKGTKGFFNMELKNSGKEAEEGMDEISSLDPWCCGWPDSYFASLMCCS
jgi:hypothetical protein